jgi:cytochrome c
MRRTIAIVATTLLGFAGGIAIASPELAKSSGCTNCHDVEAKKVGPSFKSIAAKYKGQADAEAKLVATLSEGKKHPATKGSDDDKKTLVKWVLSQ